MSNNTAPAPLIETKVGNGLTYSFDVNALIQKMVDIVGENYVVTDKDALEPYSHDETEDLVYVPAVVVKPITPIEISEILIYANEHKIPVTARGAGTGLSGSALAVYGGVILSMERFNKILDIDEANHQATVEPGVVNEAFQDAVKAKGLFYPVDPASKGSCFLGGNLAQSSGGPRAVKYGTTRDNVLNLEVVLPTGEIIWTGANVLKYSTGYNLTHLMVGSEGTLGIITKAVFKLRPYPAHNIVMLVPFESAEEACQAVSALFMAGCNPSCLEFMERDAIDWAISYTESKIVVPENIQAHLVIEVDGPEADALMPQVEKIFEVVSQFKIGETLLGQSADEKEAIWKLRRQAPYAVRHNSVYKEEDTVVPRAYLPQLLKGVKALGAEYGFKSVCYGHAGDGNLHINIIKAAMTEEEWHGEKLKEGIREVFKLVVNLGGTISGEHGIGYVQKPYIGIALADKNLELMRGIKHVFDPNNILNPGKIF